MANTDCVSPISSTPRLPLGPSECCFVVLISRLKDELRNVKLFEFANLAYDGDLQPRTLAAPLRARLLLAAAITLAQIARSSSSEWSPASGRFLLPASMPGNRSHQPALPPSRDGSIAATSKPYSSRPAHGRQGK